MLVRTSIAAAGEDAARKGAQLQRDLLSEVRNLPGVAKAAGVRTLPFAPESTDAKYWFDGGPVFRPGEGPSAQVQVVTPGYFETAGISLHRGRDFEDGDVWGRTQVAIVNRALAREAFGDSDPLGRVIRCGMTMQSLNGMRIVGVVGDARQIAPGEPPRPEIFIPYLQHPGPGSNLTLLVQTGLEPYSLSAAVRETVRRLDAEVPVRFSTMREIYSDSLSYPRFRSMLLACFALFALGVAVVGIYGVISYLVTQRTAEIGLRFALGAAPARMFRFVVGGSMRMVVAGLAAGVAGTLALSQALRPMLFEVGPNDPVTLAGVMGVFGFAALAAAVIPAIRAARIDPAAALRRD